MNLFQLVLKQMRQRALSSTLTILSVLLGVALAIATLIAYREGHKLFVQTDFGYDVLLGPNRGSGIELVLNTAYHMGGSAGTIPYEYFEQFPKQLPANVRGVKWKVPFTVGDNYKGLRVVGTLPTTFLPTLFPLQDSLLEFRDKIDSPDKPTARVTADQLRDYARQMHQIAKERVPYDADACKQIEAMAAGLDKVASDLGTAGATLTEPQVPPIYSALGDSNDALRKFSMYGPFEYRSGESFELAQGRVFYPNRFEAIIGSETARITGLKVGDKFQVTHGLAVTPNPDIHPEQWTIVGILKPTVTANDRVLFVPIISVYAIFEHREGMVDIAKANAVGKARQAPPPSPAKHEEEAKHYTVDKDGDITLDLPKKDWLLSSIAVKARGVLALPMIYYIRDLHDSPVMGINPATVMREFFETFFRGSSLVLLMMAILVTVVAAVSILVSIYNSISARFREIAILRALGATRWRVVTIICAEAGIIGLAGALLGLVCGHLLAGVGSYYSRRLLGQGLSYTSINWLEVVYLTGVVVLAVLAGFVPAMKAYRTPVAANLVAA